ncbi:related to tubulin-tyrosine ligase [Cephalotrichum gorgonifer]|uniref:Related to tubulin-tyrosine ligase n=1 Tax=Cephalotrichum gorgonifer TaxID=2041049 RepID=A0AAE8MW71_9PEZI|nr:related to tubulin-tyrosine ligase [Cephalotrichum gorgonifer]
MYALINAASPWLNEHIKSFIREHVPDSVFIDDVEDFPDNPSSVFQFCDGWALNANFAVANSIESALINAYPSSDAIARKDYLSKVVEIWTAKRPESVLRNHVPVTVRLNLDYAEYVEESLAEADDLTLLYSLEENEGKSGPQREWWILKPALVDCGAGIRLFSTLDELASHLELAEYEYDDDETSEEVSEVGEVAGAPSNANKSGFASAIAAYGLDAMITATGAMTLDGKPEKSQGRSKRPQYIFKADGRIPSAQMRTFVAQRYIASVPVIDKRKWHVRAYVLSIGRLKVYTFKEMLTLLAGEDYEPPWENPSLRASLTNTALQDEADFNIKEPMRDFATIDDDVLPGDWKAQTFDQICKINAEIFLGAVHTMADKFTTINKSFELFAVDYLLDTSGNAWLLEVNETPAFYQHGFAGPLSLRLMESVICIAMDHMGKANMADPRNNEVRERMKLVLDETDTLAKSMISNIVPEDSV